jgi:hypothetical protein
MTQFAMGLFHMLEVVITTLLCDVVGHPVSWQWIERPTRLGRAGLISVDDGTWYHVLLYGDGQVVVREAYHELPSYSYYYSGYTSVIGAEACGYTYVRKPRRDDRTVYMDSSVSRVRLRDDVKIIPGRDGVSCTWDIRKGCPIE